MSQFAPSPLNGSAATAYETTQRAARNDGVANDSNQVVRGEDQVELSTAARLLGGSGPGSEIRQDLVARIRSEIAAGTYETPDKLDATVSRLARDLG